MNPDQETYEGEDPDAVRCELCGNAYEARELDRGHCPPCADFADLDEWMY